MLKYDNCKCHPKWGPDDLVSIPALNGTVECNKFLCFNLSDIDRKKKKINAALSAFWIMDNVNRYNVISSGKEITMIRDYYDDYDPLHTW